MEIWLIDESTGPKDNPAELPSDAKSSIYSLLTKLFSAMENSKNSEKPIKFLSRYDDHSVRSVDAITAIIGS